MSLYDDFIQEIKKILAEEPALNDLFEKLFVSKTFYVENKEEADDKIRKSFVGLQGKIELALATLLSSSKNLAAKVIIHTQLPPTPLCSPLVKPELLDRNLVGPNTNPEVYKTVTDRAQILRYFLANNGVLVGAYHTERGADQQKVFDDLVEANPTCLFKYVLLNKVDDSFSGATYLVYDKTGESIEQFAFSIQAYQIIQNSTNLPWQMWLGPTTEPLIQQRITQIVDFLADNGFDFKNGFNQEFSNFVPFISTPTDTQVNQNDLS